MDNTAELYCHIKTGNTYQYIEEVVNATNKNDGEAMILYCRNGKYFVREKTEFFEKFVKLNFLKSS